MFQCMYRVCMAVAVGVCTAVALYVWVVAAVPLCGCVGVVCSFAAVLCCRVRL